MNYVNYNQYLYTKNNNFNVFMCITIIIYAINKSCF